MNLMCFSSSGELMPWRIVRPPTFPFRTSAVTFYVDANAKMAALASVRLTQSRLLLKNSCRDRPNRVKMFFINIFKLKLGNSLRVLLYVYKEGFLFLFYFLYPSQIK